MFSPIFLDSVTFFLHIFWKVFLLTRNELAQKIKTISAFIHLQFSNTLSTLEFNRRRLTECVVHTSTVISELANCFLLRLNFMAYIRFHENRNKY